MLTVLKEYHPSDWSSFETSKLKIYEETTLPWCSAEHSRLKGVMGSFAKSVDKISKVANPYLYGSFLLKQAEYKSRGISYNIKELYHDTGKSKVDSILSTNLDWRLVYRSKFGRGVSFSPCTTYANKYSSMHNGTDRAMIVADVIVGATDNITSGDVLPSASSDTNIGNSGKVYVKFYDDEFYIKYVVYYKSIEHQAKRPRYDFFYFDDDSL